VGSDAPPIRAAEVVGAISLATDLGTGQPLEHTLRTAILSVRLGELAGASAEELFDAYYVALLHSFGCTSDGPEATELYGDDIEPRAAFALVDAGNLEEVGAFLTAMVGGGRPPDVRAAMVADALANALPLAQATFALHCEVAQRLAGWLGFGSGTLDALAFVFERWDGHGLPAGAAAQDIALPARLLHVARDISVFLSAAGADEARAVIERRAGAAYDPRLAALATEHFDELLSGLDEARIWEQAIDSEPPPQRWMAGEEIDAAFGVVATFTDLKSRWLRGHAEGVAELAEAAAWRLELAADEVTRVRRAALALDLGRVGVSNAIWEKPGPLGLGDWERVRLHPYFTERAFAHSRALAPIGALASAHHERLDGSGYHRKALASGLERPARILAAADSYQAMREQRPHRPALDAPGAEAELLGQAREGRLCPEAVDAVLAAAGHRVRRRSNGLPGGLTNRELEVLLALVEGQSNHEIGEGLGISAKTAGHHVQHIYEKAGVRSRAAATVWAFENSLVQTA
jgi:HD-GYP domain-containing protein (c-di-GMP phosphodiesterase class II)